MDAATQFEALVDGLLCLMLLLLLLSGSRIVGGSGAAGSGLPTTLDFRKALVERHGVSSGTKCCVYERVLTCVSRACGDFQRRCQ